MRSSKLKRSPEQIRGPRPCEPPAISICGIRVSSGCLPAASAHGRIDDSYGAEAVRAVRAKLWPQREPTTAIGQKPYALVGPGRRASPSPFPKGSDALAAAD